MLDIIPHSDLRQKKAERLLNDVELERKRFILLYFANK